MANLSDFKVGDVLLTYGADMGCHKCVCKTQIVSIDERGIVTKSDEDDFLMLATWENMQHFNDYFLYSVEQEKAMQEQCDNEYNEWLEACRKQEEEAHRHHIEWTEGLKKLIKEKGHLEDTHMVFDLSGKSDFFRWKQYNIMHINDELQLFGVAADGDTMCIDMCETPVPTWWEIEREIKNKVA